MKFEVFPIFGAICTTFKSGQSLYEVIIQNLKVNEKVELDFSGVRIVASPFFNGAIGQLYNDFSQDELNQNLIISNLVETGQEIIERIKDNAVLLKDKEAQKALDDALTSAY